MPGFTAPLTRTRGLLTAVAALIIVGALALLPSAATASGCTVSWTAKGSGSWSTPGNWSTGKVPGSTDEACIAENGPASYTVELTGEVTVKSLTIGGTEHTQTLAVASTSSAHAFLTTTAGITNGSHGVIVLTNGDAAGNNATIIGPVTNAGSIKSEVANGGARSIQGNLTNTGTIAINATTSYNGTKATLTNEGSLTIANEKALVVTGESGVVNGTGGSITATGNGSLNVEPGCSFTEGAGTTTGTKPVFVRDGALRYTGAGASSVFVRGASTLAGNISAGQTVQIESSSTQNATTTASASFSNAGTITLTNGDASGNSATLVISAGTLTNKGSIKSEVAIGGVRSIQGSVTNAGTLAINATTSYNGTKATLTNEGALTIANEQALVVTGESGVVNGTGGSIIATGNGSLNVEPSSSFTEGAGTTTGTKAVFVRDGALKYTGAGSSSIFVRGSSSLAGNISAGQTLQIESSSTEHSETTASSSFSNAGTIVLTNGDGAGNNATLVISSGTLTNSGSIKSEPGVGGARSIQGNLTNTGTLAINTTTSYNGSKATLTNEGALTIANEKALTVTGESGVVNGAGGSITATGNGSLNVEPSNSFTEGAGTTSGTKAVFVRDGALKYTGAGASSIFMRGSSTLAGNISAGQTLQIESSSIEHATTTASASFSNAGTIVLTNGDAATNNATLVISSGALTNKGSINSEKGVGGVRSIQGNVTNAGTLNVNGNTSYNASEVALTNEGTINIPAAIALTVTGKSTVSNEKGGKIVVVGSGTLFEVEGTFNEGLGTTTTAGKAEPVILDRVKLAYTPKGGASKIVQEGSSSLSGAVNTKQVLIIASTCSEHATDSSGAFVNSGTIILTNSGGCGNNVTLNLGGVTLENKGTIEVLWPHGGTRTIEGSVVNEKTVSVEAESAQALKVTGSFTQGAKGQYSPTVAGSSNFSRLAVTGAVTLGGKLAMEQLKFNGTKGETFAIISGVSRTGEFASVTGNEVKTSKLHYIPHYTATGVNLIVE